MSSSVASESHLGGSSVISHLLRAIKKELQTVALGSG